MGVVKSGLPRSSGNFRPPPQARWGSGWIRIARLQPICGCFARSTESVTAAPASGAQVVGVSSCIINVAAGSVLLYASVGMTVRSVRRTMSYGLRASSFATHVISAWDTTECPVVICTLGATHWGNAYVSWAKSELVGWKAQRGSPPLPDKYLLLTLKVIS